MKLLLLLLPFAIPFGSLAPLPLGGANVTLADVLVLLMLALWFARGTADRRLVIPSASLAWPFALFFGGALLSVTGALSLQASVKELVKWAELYLVYWVTASQVPMRYIPWLLVSVLLSGTAEAVVGIYQSLFRVGPEGFLLFGGKNLRAYGTFEQPNPFGGYLALIVPVAAGILLTLGSGLLRRGKAAAGGGGEGKAGRGIEPAEGRPAVSSFLLFTAAAAAAGTGLAAIWMSASRGALAAVGTALVLTFVLPSRRAALWSTALAGLLALALFMSQANLLPPFVSDRFAVVTEYFGVFDVRGVRVNDANFAVVERMAHWQAAWNMFEDHPWLGVGFGNYAVVYPAYALPRWEDPLGHAHNYVLNVLAEGGAVTAFGYLVFWAAAFLVAWRAVRRAPRPWKPLAAGLLGALAALTVHNLVDNLYVHSVQLQIGLYLGLIEQLARSGRAGDGL